jgi:hypothetical protein
MPGADEEYSQSELLMQVLLTGKMIITRTSKTKINVPANEHTAPAFITLSICLIANSIQKRTFNSIIDSLGIYCNKAIRFIF